MLEAFPFSFRLPSFLSSTQFRRGIFTVKICASFCIA
jgi:hypothetical protein